jgi:HK97 family phage major capsid protein
MTRQFTPVAGNLDILRESGLGTAAWIGEGSSISPTDFTMDKVTLNQKRVGTAVELSQHLINDSGIDVVGYSTNVLSRRLGLELDRKMIVGQKATQFEGLQGNINISEVTAASATAIAIDELEQLYLALNPEFVPNAVWVMNRATFNMIAKLKDANGQYFLVRDVAETGVTYRLFGRPVLINDAVDNHATGSRSVLFGNFEAGYATMIKKGIELQDVTDSTQALKGSRLLMLDGYMDGKIYNENAFKWLRVTGTAVNYPA